MAWKLCSVTQVEEVKLVARVAPVMARTERFRAHTESCSTQEKRERDLMRLSYAQGTERERYASTTTEAQNQANLYIYIYIHDSIERGFEPDLAQTGKKTLSTHKDNAGSEMEPLPEARKLSMGRGSLPGRERYGHHSFGAPP